MDISCVEEQSTVPVASIIKYIQRKAELALTCHTFQSHFVLLA